MAYRPTPVSNYYSGQGRLGIGDRDSTTGEFSNVVYPGNVTSLTIDIATTKYEHKENMTGSRAIDKTVIQEKNATFKFTIESLSIAMLKLGLFGSSSNISAGTVTDELHKVKRGSAIPLKRPGVSNVAITLAAGGTSVAKTNNWEVDEGFGMVYCLPGSAVLLDDIFVKVSYSYGAAERLDGFTTGTPPERYLRFEGLNTADGSLRLIELPRAAFEPITGLEYINEEFGSAEFNGSMLPDLSVSDPNVSQYYRETRPTGAV